MLKRFSILRPGVAIIVALAVLALVAVACSSDDEDDTSAPTDRPTSPVATTPSGAGGGVQAASAELAGLSQEWSETSAKITYQMTSSGTDAPGNGAMMLAWKYPDWRVEIESDDGSFIMIAAGDTSYICSSEGGVEQCLSLGSVTDDNLPVPFISTFTNPDEIANLVGDAGGIKTSDRKIAGQDARCFSFSEPGGSGDGEVCFSSDGLLLLIDGSDDSGSFKLEATKVSKDVSDNEFKPPYPVVDLGGLLGTPQP